MDVTALLNLDRTLESTWQTYATTLKTWLSQGDITQSVALVNQLPDPQISYSVSDYPFYAPLAHAYNQTFDHALALTQDAYIFGFPRFWYFNPENQAWGDKASPDYLLAAPLHNHPTIQNYVKPRATGRVDPWGFDIATTPFCWFEKKPFTRKGAKCYISGKRIKKGDEVYYFRFFNGSRDIPEQPFVARIDAFHSDPGAMENLQKYQTNQYQLTDYAIKIRYKHPFINAFFHTLDTFNLDDALSLIASPPVSPTPCLLYHFDDYERLPVYDFNHPEYQLEYQLNYATGGSFLNLLYVLVKCGYLDDIWQRLPDLPDHFPLALLCFESKDIRRRVVDYLNLPELMDLYPLALKPYTKKKPQEVLTLIDFGQRNPDFTQKLAASLHLYEHHLYSNYHPGVNWFFQSFQAFVYARGGGLLDFLIANATDLPIIKQMIETQSYPNGLSNNTVDGYDNSLPHVYRTATLNRIVTGSADRQVWLDLPPYIQKSPYYNLLKSQHKKTVQIGNYWQKRQGKTR
ncbi:MAG: hypothetical protein AAF485_00715 [Chloroflexota bacterium]